MNFFLLQIKPCCLDRLDNVNACRGKDHLYTVIVLLIPALTYGFSLFLIVEEQDESIREGMLSSASIPVLAVGILASFDEVNT
jgi:hypothetical protein